MPDWFLKPHRRYGTTYRVLYLIVGLQLVDDRRSAAATCTCWARPMPSAWCGASCSRRLAMVVLRFKDRSPREFKVPLNIRIRGVEVPIGLSVDLPDPAVHGGAEPADQGGGHDRRHRSSPPCSSRSSWSPSATTRSAAATRRHQHLEQFNQQTADEIDADGPRPGQALPQAGGHPLDAEPLHAREDAGRDRSGHHRRGRDDRPGRPARRRLGRRPDLDHYNRELMTAVVNRAEKAGKHVQPLIVPTNNPLYRRDQHGQGPAGPGTGPGRVEHLHGRRADRADRLLLDQPPRRAARAADGAAS